jgi:CRP-like cAMP-binding protein
MLAVAQLGRGDFFGERCLFGLERRNASIVAKTTVDLAALPAQAFSQLLREQPRLQMAIEDAKARREAEMEVARGLMHLAEEREAQQKRAIRREAASLGGSRRTSGARSASALSSSACSASTLEDSSSARRYLNGAETRRRSCERGSAERETAERPSDELIPSLDTDVAAPPASSAASERDDNATPPTDAADPQPRHSRIAPIKTDLSPVEGSVVGDGDSPNSSS